MICKFFTFDCNKDNCFSPGNTCSKKPLPNKFCNFCAYKFKVRFQGEPCDKCRLIQKPKSYFKWFDWKTYKGRYKYE